MLYKGVKFIRIEYLLLNFIGMVNPHTSACAIAQIYIEQTKKDQRLIWHLKFYQKLKKN